MRRPRTKIELLRYYEALHFALEREFTGFPEDLRVASLSKECKVLENRLENVPMGKKHIDDARWNTLHGDRRFFAATHEFEGAQV